MYIHFHVNCSLFLRIFTNFTVLAIAFYAFLVQNVTKIRSVGVLLFHVNRKTDRFSARDYEANSRLLRLIGGQSSKQPLSKQDVTEQSSLSIRCVIPLSLSYGKFDQYLSIYKTSIDFMSY